MRNSRERTLKELYDFTKKLCEPKITSILQGACRMQGPVDESDCIQRMDSQNFPVESRCSSLDENLHTIAEPGTCNVCSAPCFSCLHLNKTSPLMEPEFGCGSSLKTSGRKEDESSSFIDVIGPIFKNKEHSEHKHVGEGSNLITSSSSHNSSLANAESREMVRASVFCDTSVNLEVTRKASADAAEGDRHFHEETSCTSGSLSHFCSCRASDLHHSENSDLTKEKFKSECHRCSISCIPESEDANIVGHTYDKVGRCTASDGPLSHGDKKAIQNATDSNSDSKVGQDKLCRLELKRKRSATSSTSIIKDESRDYFDLDQNPLSRSTLSPIAQCPCSVSECAFSFHNSGNMDRFKSIKSSTDEKEASVAEPAACTVDGKNYTPVPSGKVSKDNPTLVYKKETNVCLGSEINTDSRLLSDGTMRTSNMSLQSVNPSSLIQTSNVQVHEVNQGAKSENEGSEEPEDDVKICDICGDAGQEAFLAICSRCDDGAEHTYCMRIKLTKVPEGDWLCEECQMKEDNQNLTSGKSAIESQMTGENCSNGKSLKVGSKFDSKHLPLIETKATEEYVRVSIKKSSRAEISSKQNTKNQELTSTFDKKRSEARDGSCGTDFPRKTTSLSRENSFNKSDLAKPKISNFSMPCGQLENMSILIGSSQTSSDCNPSKIQSHTESMKGSLLKSFSFSNSKVAKVKQLRETIPQNPKMIRDSNYGSTRKDGLVRKITKSVSFKNVSSGCYKIENKADLIDLPKSDDFRGPTLVKERSVLDKKISCVSDRPSVSPSISATSISHVKMDRRVAQYDKNLKKKPELTNPVIRKVSKDVCSLVSVEGKKHLSQSGNSGSQLLLKSEDQKHCPLSPKAADTTHPDDKSKESASISSPRAAVSGSSRILRCQRCNGTGHSTQMCAVDRHCVSAIKPSSERNSKDGGNRGNRWKDSSEVAISKPGTKRNNQYEEMLTNGRDLNYDVTSRNFPSTSLSVEKIVSSLEGAFNAQKMLARSSSDSKVSAAIHVKQKEAGQKKSLSIPKKNDVNTAYIITDDSRMMTNVPNLPNEAFMYSLSASVIPEYQMIWQGAFEIVRAGNSSAIYDGFQAHLSTCVSPKVVEVAAKFPYRIKLEEVPLKSSWPLQFQETSPKENNIALFFFAKDIESYEKHYQKQLDRMIKNDLALRGSINVVELLIFPSNLLPQDSQRWNKLFFLWGVFKETKQNCSKELPVCEKKPSIVNLSKKSVVQDLYEPDTSRLSISQDLDCKGRKKDLSSCEASSMTKIINSTASMEFQNVSGTENKIHKTDETFIQKTSHQVFVDDKVLEEQTPCSFPTSSSSSRMSQLPSILISSPERKIHIDIEQLPPEEEDDVTCENELSYELNSRGHAGPLHDDRVANVHTKYSIQSLYSGSLSDAQEAENQKCEKKTKHEVSFTKTEAVLNDHLSEVVLEKDLLSLESRPNLKRVHSSPIDKKEHYYTYISKPTDEKMMLEETSCIDLNDEKVKKIKLHNGGHVPNSSVEGTSACKLSSKIHPLTCSFMEDRFYHEKLPDIPNGAEKYLFQMNQLNGCSATRTMPEELVHIISSDGESLEHSAPDLELALGDKKNLEKQEILPLSSLKDSQKSKGKLPISVDVGGDEPASLSLSLAFPASQKAWATKTISESDPLLPDKPCIKTSLFLLKDLNET